MANRNARLHVARRLRICLSLRRAFKPMVVEVKIFCNLKTQSVYSACDLRSHGERPMPTAGVPNASGSRCMVRFISSAGILLVLALALQIASCSPSRPPESMGEARGVLTLGLLPDESAERQLQKYAPIVRAIRANTGFDVRLDTPADYAELVFMFSKGEVDLAYFGGYTFASSHEQSGAIPLVMRDIDASFISYLIVRRDSAAKQLSDLKGAVFGFGSRLSTSGHIMPRYFFEQEGIVSESFFSTISFSGAHDRTIQWVIDGTVDAGVVNGQILNRLLTTAGDTAGAVRILWQSPPYVDYVWAVQPSMTIKTRQAILDAFLSLSHDDPTARRFLEDVGAGYFIPADISDFEQLQLAIGFAQSTWRVDEGDI